MFKYPKRKCRNCFIGNKKREKPLINKQNKNKYEDFVTYTFSQPKPNIAKGLSKVMTIKPTTSKPSELNFKDWVLLFDTFTKIPKKQQSLVENSFKKQLKQQENIEKINRTRIDPNWRNIKS